MHGELSVRAAQELPRVPRPPPASFGSEPGDDAAAPDTPPPSLDRGVRVCGPHLSTTVSPGMEAIMSKLAPGRLVDALLSGSESF